MKKLIQETIAIMFLTLMLFVSSFTIYIIAHEATHLALANKATGICFGKCETAASPTGWGIATAWGDHNQASRNEKNAENWGVAAMGAWAILSIIAIKTTIQKGDD